MVTLTQNNLDTLKACRYCPMCRQSCPSEFISYKESDAPRGRVILLHSVYQGGKEFEESTIRAVYNCFLCGACKSWCSGHEMGGYDIPELIKSARKDIVRRGLAPQSVQTIKDSLFKNGNTLNKDKGGSYTATTVEKKAEVLYISGERVNYTNPEIAEAFVRILDRCKISYTLLKDEPTSGKELDLLGYGNEAREKARNLAERIKATDCKIVVVADPLVYDALKNDYPAWKLILDCEIVHVSEYLLNLIRSRKLKLKPMQTKITLADSEYLGRFNTIFEAPREIIKVSAGKNFIEMQWHHEYLQTTGEAVFTFNDELFTKGNELGKKISLKAEDIDAVTIVTLSAIAKNNISATTGLKVIDIAEFAAYQMV